MQIPSIIMDIIRQGGAPPDRDSHYGWGELAYLDFSAAAIPSTAQDFTLHAAPDVVSKRLTGSESYGLIATELFVCADVGSTGAEPAPASIQTLSKGGLRVHGAAVGRFRTSLATLGIGHVGGFVDSMTTATATTVKTPGVKEQGRISLQRPLYFSNMGDQSERLVQYMRAATTVVQPDLAEAIRLHVFAFGYWDQAEKFPTAIQEMDAATFPKYVGKSFAGMMRDSVHNLGFRRK